MNILFFKWSSSNENLVIHSLEQLGHKVFCFYKNISNFANLEIDSDIMQTIIFNIHQKAIDCAFSLNYIPLLASITDSCHIPYISWMQDSPAFTLYSPTKNYSSNYQFVFDKEEFNRLKTLGATRIQPITLSSAPDYFSQRITKSSEKKYDVCFLGNLYSDTDFERITFMNEYLKGYINALLNAQKEVYGTNLIEDALTSHVAKEILALSGDNIPTGYCINEAQAAAYVLEKKLTGIERTEYLSAIGEHFNLTIYTGSHPEDKIKAQYKGYADYQTQMPQIFYDSKINLHFAPRNIHSGVSLRVFDVLACHGFLLTTWAPEIAEYFEDGKDLVMFSCKEELLDKIAYYLSNESERGKISESGYKKICKSFTYKKILTDIFEKIV